MRESRREEWCTQAYKELKETLDSQTAAIKSAARVEREKDSLLVKQIIQSDLASFKLENELRSFKKQLFAQE